MSLLCSCLSFGPVQCDFIDPEMETGVADNDLRLWGIGTNRTMRVHWMLAELDLDYELRPIGPRTGETLSEEFLRLNPKHKIPLLEHGAFVISESSAIIAYLSETFAAPEGFFVPRDEKGRARLNEWCSFVMMELDAGSLYVIRRHEQLSEIYGEAPRAVEAARQYFSQQIECMIERFGNDPAPLMPEGMSIADILLETCVDFALSLDIDMPQRLIAHRARLMDRPAYRRAFHANYPERTPPNFADGERPQPRKSNRKQMNQ